MCVTLTPHRHIDKSGYQEREPTFDFLFATTMQLSVAYKTTTVHRLAFGAVLDLGQIYHRQMGTEGMKNALTGASFVDQKLRQKV